MLILDEENCGLAFAMRVRDYDHDVRLWLPKLKCCEARPDLVAQIRDFKKLALIQRGRKGCLPKNDSRGTPHTNAAVVFV